MLLNYLINQQSLILTIKLTRQKKENGKQL